MLEIPEAGHLAKQCIETIAGKVIIEVIANNDPHKLAWYVGEPETYPKKLLGKTIISAVAFGGFVQLELGDVCLAFSDGIQLLYIETDGKLPKKHQLMIRFKDQSCLVASVRMYGGIWCFTPGEWEYEYYELAKSKPSPLSDAFTEAYFVALIEDEQVGKKSVKAFLATEQRIPGLGNGVLQDILYTAGVHPKRKIYSLSEQEKQAIYQAVRHVLSVMTEQGGRDTEKDLFGNPGGYKTQMSKNTLGHFCKKCGEPIRKEAYMGGSIYFCPACQKI